MSILRVSIDQNSYVTYPVDANDILKSQKTLYNAFLELF